MVFLEGKERLIVGPLSNNKVAAFLLRGHKIEKHGTKFEVGFDEGGQR